MRVISVIRGSEGRPVSGLVRQVSHVEAPAAGWAIFSNLDFSSNSKFRFQIKTCGRTNYFAHTTALHAPWLSNDGRVFTRQPKRAPAYAA